MSENLQKSAVPKEKLLRSVSQVFARVTEGVRDAFERLLPSVSRGFVYNDEAMDDLLQRFEQGELSPLQYANSRHRMLEALQSPVCNTL